MKVQLQTHGVDRESAIAFLRPLPGWIEFETEGKLAPPGGYCICLFEESTREVEDAVRESVAAQTLVLCLSMAALKPQATWRLLQSGAGDVIVATEPTGIPQACARLERWRLVDELLQTEPVAGKLIGKSLAWSRMLRQAVEVARCTDGSVLVIGESGTGKELLARLFHDLDKRRNAKDLVTVDCTTIVPELSGSELFGHEKGAFTGAFQQRDGAFAQAHRGTLFLDEVGELPLPLQAQLLRAVQERTYKRVGGNAWHTADFRLVCATNRDLREAVRKGEFRSDLYYRLASWVFEPPPLRNRREDILPLARHFLGPMSDGAADADDILDDALAGYLSQREYPGNVRELKQLASRIRERHVGPGSYSAADLPEEERARLGEVQPWPDAEFEESIRRAVESGTELKQISQSANDVAIRNAVQRENGNLQRAAKRLGVTDRALQMRRASGRI